MKLKILFAGIAIGIAILTVMALNPKEELIEETRAFIPVMEETHEDRPTDIPDTDSDISDTSDSTDTVCADERPTEPLPEETYIEEEVIYEEWYQPDVPDALDYIADYDDWNSDWSDIPDTDDSEVVSWIAPESDIHYGFTDEEVAEIARIVWLEVGICSCDYYTQYLTACVILNRYLDWGYSSLYEVIHASGQYATADMYTEYDGSAIRIGERTWSAVYDALADTDRNPHYQMRGGAGMPVYYWDTEWDVCFYY